MSAINPDSTFQKAWLDSDVSGDRSSHDGPKRKFEAGPFLAMIGEEISLLTEVTEIIQTVGARIRDRLGLAGFVFVQVDDKAGMVEVTPDGRGEQTPPKLGRHRLDDYFPQEFQSCCRAGVPIVVGDAARDLRSSAGRLGAAESGALVSVPVLRFGIWRSSLGAHRSGPQEWQRDEIGLLTQIAFLIQDQLDHVSAKATSARLAAIVEFSNDAIISENLDGIITSWNKGAHELYGYTAQEMIGRSIRLLMPEDRVQEEDGVLARIRRGESLEHYETVRRAKDGRLVGISLTVSPIFDIRGAVVGASKISRDITARKMFEQELRESELRFRSMANAMSQLAWIARPDGYITWYNQGWYEYTGTTPEQMEGWGWQTVHHPKELPLVVEAWKASIASAEPFEMTFPMRGADGKFRQFLTRGIPVKNADGIVTQWIGTNTDVDDIVTMEQALRENNHRMILATRATGVGIWEWNIHTNRVHWDAEMFRIYGIAPTPDGTVPYSVWQDALLPDELEAQEELVRQTLNGQSPGLRDIRIRKADTMEIRHVQLVDAVRNNTQGEPEWVVGTNLDITARRRATRNASFLASITDDLVNFSKMEDLMVTIGRKLADHLELDRCAPTEADNGASKFHTICAQDLEGGPSCSGDPGPFRELAPEIRQSLIAGECWVIRDTSKTPHVNKFIASDIGSMVCFPIFDHGRLIFLFTVCHSRPQDWREDEIQLVREVACRLWTRMERSRVEESLARAMAESEQQRRLYHTVLSNTPDLIYVFDLDHRFIYANEALLAMWGVSSQEALGKSCHELGYEAWHAAMYDREIDFAVAQRKPVRSEVPFSGPNGRRVYEHILVPVLDAQGRVEAVAGTTRDITDRKQEESAQAAERKVFERIATRASLLETLDTLLLETEAQSENGIMCAIQIMDKSRNYLVHGAAPSLPEAYSRAIDGIRVGPNSASCGTAAFERAAVYVENIATDPRWADFRELAEAHFLRACCSLPILSLEGEVLGTVAMYYLQPQSPGEHDRQLIERARHLAGIIIERKQAEAALAEQTAGLLQADRSKNEFLAMLAHELRNPLATISHATEILRSAPASGAERERAQQLIARQTDNMSRMIDDLMDVSRITEGKIELRRQAVELTTILTAAAETARQSAEANRQQLSVVVPVEPVVLDVDPTRLEQVIGNLLGNACKYSGTGSHILLSAEVIDGNQVMIRVADDGMGIAPELLPHVFDLFVQSSRTLDRSHGGLGIGLTIVDQLVKLHGGTIEALSPGLGHGTEFVIRLPLPNPACPATPLPATSEAKSKSLRILIVDDNEDAAETMALLQQYHGHDTRIAYTGPDAVLLAADYIPHLVLLDIGLPIMDGYEVARRMRAIPEMKHAFLIAITGYGSEEDRRKAHDAGFDAHLSKPADLEILRNWISKIT